MECSKCSETFKNIDILQAHFKEKHNDAIFSCFACDDVFSEPSALEQHMSEYHKSKKKIDHLVKQKPSNRPKKLNSYQKPVKLSKPAETQLTCEIWAMSWSNHCMEKRYFIQFDFWYIFAYT